MLDSAQRFRFNYADHGEPELPAMAMRLGKLYDALVQAGASTEKASDAAEELATFATRMQSIERKLRRLEAPQWATSVAATAILVRVYWP